MRVGFLVLWGVLAGAPCVCVGATPLSIGLLPYAGQVEVSYQGTRLALYEFQPSPRVPTLYVLTAPGGANLLQADRVGVAGGAEVGLSLALRANDLDFSAEDEESGWQKSGRELDRKVTRDGRGRIVAEVGHEVFWVPTEASPSSVEAALLVEQRRLRFVLDTWAREVALEWVSELRAGPSEEQVWLGGENDRARGFQLVVAPGFELVSGFLSGGGKLTFDADEKHTSGSADWLALSGTLEESGMTVSLFSDPANPGQAEFLLVSEPKRSVALRPKSASVVGRSWPGEALRLRYLVTLHSRALTREAVSLRFDRWMTELEMRSP